MNRKLIVVILSALLVSGIGSYYKNKRGAGLSTSGRACKAKYEKLPKGDLAFHRADFEFKKTRDPQTNTIPSNIRRRERDYAAATMRKGPDMGAEQTGLRIDDWHSRGPRNIGGRLLAVALDVDDENTILAGSASGGLWRSEDGGASWNKVTASDEVQSVSCLAQDTRPDRHRIWYHGTGELLSTTDRSISTRPRTIGYGSGVYKSLDNGGTWQPLSSTQGEYSEQIDEVFRGIWNIALDPTDEVGDTVYTAGLGAIMKSTDGGDSWAPVLGDLQNKSFCTDVVVNNQGMVFAGLSTFSTGGSPLAPKQSGLWFSSDGRNWIESTPPDFPSATRVIKLALAPANQNVLYVLTENPMPDDDPVFGFTASIHTFWKGVYDPAEETWTWEDRTANLPGGGAGNILSDALNSIGGYALTLAVKPDDENTIFIGGTNLYRSTNAFTDPAATTIIGGYPYDFEPHNLHPDQHGLAFLPSDADVLFSASDGGLYRTEGAMSSTVTWNQLNNGLTTTQFYSVALNETSAGDDFIMGGLQDNATVYTFSDDPDVSWDMVVGGDGLSCAVAGDKAWTIASVYNGQVFTFRFDRNGQAIDVFFQTPDFLDTGKFNFYTLFALDPVSNTIFYLPAKNRLYRKDDLAAASENEDLRNIGWSELTGAALPEGESITALAVSTEPANRVYYGSDAGKVYRLDQANTDSAFSVEITGPDFPIGGFTACLEVDPENADRLLAVFSNYNVNSLFYSIDGGTTWTSVGGNLEEYQNGAGAGPSVRWAEIVHYNGRTIYFVATSVGLYSTTILRGTDTIWAQEGPDAIGNVIVDMVKGRTRDGYVAVATHGNGVYSAYLVGQAGSGGGGGGGGGCFLDIH